MKKRNVYLSLPKNFMEGVMEKKLFYVLCMSQYHYPVYFDATLECCRPRATRGVEIGGCFALVAGG